jgi:6-phosphogluconolactonase
MNKKNLSWVAVCASALLVVLLAGCPSPIGTSKDGSLSIQLTNNINARTLLPQLDMTAASYSVSGTGPGGATFFQNSSGGPVTVNGLAFGSWSVTANALNAAGTMIGSGQATVTVHTGQTAFVALSVVPLGGNGALSLAVAWPEGQVDSPSILATLTPPSGPETHLSFSVSGNQGTCSSTTIPAGYQTLTLQLLDNNITVMGAVEVVRIVAGQTTMGSYAFANVNQPGGSVQVNITPAMADPIPVSISGVDPKTTAGTSITATASAGDETVNVVYVWYLNGVSVGEGPTYNSNPLAAGFYRLDVTAYTADGTRAGSANVSFPVVAVRIVIPASRSYVYVTNFSFQSVVTGYAIGAGGLLTPLSPPTFAAGNSSMGIAVTHNGSLLYVATNGSNTVSAYAIGSSGLLTPLSTPTFAAGAYPWGIAATPNGSFLYTTTTGSNTVSGYAIGSSGLLTPLSTPAFSTGPNPHGIAVTPNGSFLYVTNYNSGTVSGYAIGPDGILTPLSTPSFDTGSLPEGIIVTPNGSFLYVTSVGSGTVWAYSIGADGLLTPLSTRSFAAEEYPRGMAITPDGSLLYVTNYLSDSVSAYAIGSGGLLTPLSTIRFAAGSLPWGIAVTPDGSSIYLANLGGNSISAYTIGSGGLLTPIGSPTPDPGFSPFGIVIVQRSSK